MEHSKRKAQLEADIADLTDKIGDKETAQDLRKKFEAIHSELGSRLEEKPGVEKIKNQFRHLCLKGKGKYKRRNSKIQLVSIQALIG